jgi:MFS superfamily sulfate permease-like transporter
MTQQQAPNPLPAGWWKADFSASLVVFLVALPLCMGIAIASGAPVTAGLVTGIVGGLVTGVLAGSPLQVSGPAAGLTVIVFQLIQQQGLERLGIVVLLAGGIQVLAGAFRLGQWFRAVSPAVIRGMLAGIGVLIFAGQFHVMVDDRPRSSGVDNLLSIPEAVRKGMPLPPPKLGTPEDRAMRVAQLKLVGSLHLQQQELMEEVHHLLVGVTDASPDANGFPAAEWLKSLARREETILATLKEHEPVHAAAEWTEAENSCAAALAALQQGDTHTARQLQDQAMQSLSNLLSAYKSHPWAAALGLTTILIIVVWHAFVERRVRVVPAPLVAVATVTALSVGFSLPVISVEVPDSLLEEIYFPSWNELAGALQPDFLFLALQVAVVASAETLLCAAAVDQMHQGPRTKYDRELAAQGLGNMVCGLLSALPMTGVIVRSSANVHAGAKSRLSAILHGLWLLVFVVFFAYVLRLIPTSCLAAILVYTGYKLVDFKSMRALLRFGKGELIIYLGTMTTIVVKDLLTGVIFGIVLSMLKLLVTFARLRITVVPAPDGGRWTMHLKGSATFLRLPKLAEALDQVPPDAELHVHFEQLAYIDHACLDLLMNWEKQHEATGGRLVVDWDRLTARFTQNPEVLKRDVRPAIASAPPLNNRADAKPGERTRKLHEQP